MSYAVAIDNAPPDLVKVMFGLVKKSDVLRAIRLAEEDARLERIANYPRSQAELAAWVKDRAAAIQASRPEPEKKSSAEPSAPAPRS